MYLLEWIIPTSCCHAPPHPDTITSPWLMPVFATSPTPHMPTPLSLSLADVPIISTFFSCLFFLPVMHRVTQMLSKNSRPSTTFHFCSKKLILESKKERKEMRWDEMRCDRMGVSSKLNELRAITQCCKSHTTLHHTTCLRERTWKTIKWRVKRWTKLGKKTKNRLGIVRSKRKVYEEARERGMYCSRYT
jgi:hypothetical protein